MPTGVPQSITDLYEVVCRAGNWLFTFVMVIAVITFLRGAIEYLMGGGNDQQVQNAKKLITYAVVGVAIAILARGIIYVIADLLNVTDASSFFTGECSA